ncbi:VanZ family protein [Brevibacillus marinus]|uniref:VanZ family protein n=1 Tax=Brevibacillus marinus TaxID=2496837 RepID=UPI0013DFDD7C|nr:VanZ family protein [Brevibacillus marinus]
MIRKIFLVLFAVYICLLLYVTLFSHPPYGYGMYTIKWNPTILAILTSDEPLAFKVRNLGGNVLLFMPFGWLFPFVLGRFQKRSALFTVAAGLAASLAIETIQWVTSIGIFDIDDVILNSLGVVLGLLCLFPFVRIFGLRQETRLVSDNQP